LDANANIGVSSIDFPQIAWTIDFLKSTSPYLQETNFVAYDLSGKDLW